MKKKKYVWRHGHAAHHRSISVINVAYKAATRVATFCNGENVTISMVNENNSTMTDANIDMPLQWYIHVFY